MFGRSTLFGGAEWAGAVVVRLALHLHTTLNTLEEDVEEIHDVQETPRTRQHGHGDNSFLHGMQEEAAHLTDLFEV